LLKEQTPWKRKFHRAIDGLQATLKTAHGMIQQKESLSRHARNQSIHSARLRTRCGAPRERSRD
jgi:hypothetical protein